MAHQHAAPVPGSGDRYATAGDRTDAFWREHTQINLAPIAALSILGLFGLGAATFMVGANLAGWYGGSAAAQLIVFPFAFTFGGIAQFLAAMWAYKARDAVATAMHGTWGAFWMAYGVYQLLIVLAVLPSPQASGVAQATFGLWFAMLAAITFAGAAAALAQNGGVFMVMLTLATGSTLLAIGWMASVPVVVIVGGIVLVASAGFAYYTAAAMMLHSTFGRVVLPTLTPKLSNRPGAGPMHPIEYELGEPGVRVGQ